MGLSPLFTSISLFVVVKVINISEFYAVTRDQVSQETLNLGTLSEDFRICV